VNFDLSSDQKMLRDTAQSFAKKESPLARLRKLGETPLGYDKAVWRKMGELGWLGVMLPESVGGFGGSLVDASLILEQLGTTLVPEPYLAAVVLGGMAILEAGTPEQHRRWLQPLGEGAITLALAYAERQGRYAATDVETRAKQAGAGWRLSGEKVFVLNGHAADTLVVSARTGGGDRDVDGVTLFAVDRDAPGLTLVPVATMDRQRAAIVRLDGVEVPSDRVLGPVGGATPILAHVLDLGAAAVCAEGVGIMETALAMTVDYLKTREQFGVKIGVFQALQHRAVDMFTETQIMRSLAIEAALRASDKDDPQRAAAVSAAKVQLAVGGKLVTQQAIQLHGGIAITEEHDIGLYFKRMHVLCTLFGDEEHHVARFATLPTFTQHVAD
jgi:alkylation response protein AidB-like acyl-CoA dehydrogenase